MRLACGLLDGWHINHAVAYAQVCTTIAYLLGQTADKALQTNVGTNDLSSARCPLHNFVNLKRIFDYLLNASL